MNRFKDEATRDIWEGRNTKAARQAVAWYHHTKAQRGLNVVYNATLFNEFRDMGRGAGFKELHGRLKGIYQLRIAGQYGIRFGWGSGGAYDIQAGDFHDED